MNNIIINILLYSFLLILVDYLYLSRISKPFGDMISSIQGKKMVMKLAPAIVVYASLVAAWWFFIYREIEKHSFKENVFRAGLLGFFIYSVYDFTNLALIDGYRIDLAIIDSLWGGILFMITTSLFISLKIYANK